MGKAKYIMLVLSICFLGCTKETDEPIEQNTFDDILGRWNVTAYYSGSYFTPIDNGDYYEFTSDQTCVYYSGNILNTYDYYKYSFNPSENQIACKHEKGWDLGIQVEFKGENKAFFTLPAKRTINQNVKVKRN